MSGEEATLRLVFTDLDGSLLDHNNYSYRDALPQLHRLERLGIPVIPASSKTAAEIEMLRSELGNQQPYIAENGAAVFIPVGYFPQQPAGTQQQGDFWICEMAEPRSRWLDLLGELHAEYAGEFDSFSKAGTAGIARMTKLSLDDAQLANSRGYSEPVLWLGTARRRQAFVNSLLASGASVQQGGRFLAISGDCDKGRALRWLRGVYLEQRPQRDCKDLAIGDSRNDIAMLEVAHTALWVRSPAHDYPPLDRVDNVLYSRDYGPAGWAEGVARWLSERTTE